MSTHTTSHQDAEVAGTQAGSAAPATARRRIPSGVALYVLASVAVSFLAASTAPTPLYSIYQSTWHFTAMTTTVVFAVYAIAVLGALLLFGRLSDFLGRRPVVLTGIALQAAALIVLCTAHGVPELFVGRIVQGLAAGVTLGAVGAGMLDFNRLRGTTANSVAMGLGTALGAMPESGSERDSRAVSASSSRSWRHTSAPGSCRSST
jgi:MFS family permease